MPDPSQSNSVAIVISGFHFKTLKSAKIDRMKAFLLSRSPSLVHVPNALELSPPPSVVLVDIPLSVILAALLSIVDIPRGIYCPGLGRSDGCS